MARLFNRVGSLRPGRSVFDLSYQKKLTCDMGQLIPVICEEMVPGDTFKVGNELVIRFQPLIAPILHEINAYVHYFFVPYRLLWDEWEDFITGGVDGESAAVIPRWVPTNTTIGSLWDYLGFPTGVDPEGSYPLDFPRRAYNLVYNEYYRDETLIDEELLTNESILNRCWEKDYFTSALPWQQRGTAPALPISGTTNAVFDFGVNGINIGQTTLAAGYSVTSNDRKITTAENIGSDATFGDKLDSNAAVDGYVPSRLFVATNSATLLSNANEVDLSEATTFNVADLRLAFQIQKWLERNARAGARYVEFLGAHFGVHPRDDRLQRPEYIGGSKSPIIISEVLQTSSTDATSPQGNLAGHGITADQTYCGSYTSTEFGLIIGLLSVMPRTAYQQGINRQWLRETRYDFYFPEFANLSEQAILTAEIFASDVEADNKQIWGYQGRYDEMRYKPSMVVGQMRTTFDYWHEGRIFDTSPELNDTFVKCIPDKRIFASQEEPGLIVSIGNLIKAIRPMPIQSNPGLIDHN